MLPGGSGQCMGFGGNQGFDRGVYILVLRALGFRVKAAVRYCLDGFYKGAFDAQSWDLVSLKRPLQLCISTLVQFVLVVTFLVLRLTVSPSQPARFLVQFVLETSVQ